VGRTETLTISAKYTNPPENPIPYFVRYHGEWSNRNRVQNGVSIRQPAYVNKKNVITNGEQIIKTNNEYTITIGDGEEHYILFDKEYVNSFMELQPISINNIPSNLRKAGLIFELVELEDNGNKVPAIRISGGKDEVKYNRVKFDHDLYVEVKTKYAGISYKTNIVQVPSLWNNNSTFYETRDTSVAIEKTSKWTVFSKKEFYIEQWSDNFGISESSENDNNGFIGFKYFGLTVLKPRFIEKSLYSDKFLSGGGSNDELEHRINMSNQSIKEHLPHDNCTMQNINNDYLTSNYIDIDELNNMSEFPIQRFKFSNNKDIVYIYGNHIDYHKVVMDDKTETIRMNTMPILKRAWYQSVGHPDASNNIEIVSTYYCSGVSNEILSSNGNVNFIYHEPHFGGSDKYRELKKYIESETHGKYKEINNKNFLGNGVFTGPFHISDEYNYSANGLVWGRRIAISETNASNRMYWEKRESPIIVPQERLNRFPFVFNDGEDVVTLLNYKQGKINNLVTSTPMPTINTNPVRIWDAQDVNNQRTQTGTESGRIQVQYKLFDDIGKNTSKYITFNITFETRESHCLYKGDAEIINDEVEKEYQSIDVWNYTENYKEYFINKDGYVEEKKN
jgi:hypothetical protein